jgi:adenylate kinase
MGPPGAGKGTQAQRLAEKFRMAHLSSGDIFRAEKASGSPLGQELSRYMEAGELVPDETVVSVMAKAIRETDAAGGLLLDGFPRTVEQARALDEQLAASDTPLDGVAVIRVDDEVVVERITGRRIAPSTGRVYHVKYMPPRNDNVDDETGETLIQRDDDTEEVVRQRLNAYHQQTAPVIEYYKTRSAVPVLEVPGEKTPEEVNDSLVAALQGLPGRNG